VTDEQGTIDPSSAVDEGADDTGVTDVAGTSDTGTDGTGADDNGTGDTGTGAVAETSRPGIAGRVRAWLGHPWLVPTLVVGLVIALPLRGVFRAPGPPMEEGFMLVFPERLLAGDIPNRDYLHLYGPGSIWTIAAFFKVFGVSLWTERVVGMLQLVGLITAMTYIGSRWGRYIAALCGAITALIIIPPIGVTALAWVGGIAFALWSVGVATRALDPGRRRDRGLLVAGLLAGAALLFRPDLIICLGLSLGALFVWALDGRGRRKLATGALIGVSPYLVHLVLAGPGNAIRGMVLEPVFELRAGRRLPFPPPHDEYTSFLNRAFAFRRFPWPLPAADQPMQIFLFFCSLFAVTALLVIIAIWAKRAGSEHGWRLVALGLFALGLLPQAVQRADTAHLSWVSCIAFGLLPAFLAEVARLRGARTLVARTVVLAPLALMLLFPHFTYRWYADYVGQSVGYDRHFYSVDHRGRSFYYGRHDVAEAAEAMFADIERLSEPGDRLIVGPGDLSVTPYSESYLYFMLPHLVPGTHYIEMDPGVANAEDSGLADEVRAADVVILSTMYDNWFEPNTSMEPGSDEPNQVLDELFCRHDRYGDNSAAAGPGQPIFELYIRCDQGEDSA
jgi:4-amino-4-deoxy-L-arabinose transferase-like glycosyltransferase